MYELIFIQTLPPIHKEDMVECIAEMLETRCEKNAFVVLIIQIISLR